MKTNESERFVRKTHPPSCFECKGPSPPPCIQPSFRTGSSVGNAISTCVVTSLLAFTSIRRAGQRAYGLADSSLASAELEILSKAESVRHNRSERK